MQLSDVFVNANSVHYSFKAKLDKDRYKDGTL